MITLEEAKKIIARELNALEIQGNPDELYEPIRYILSGEGKRIRPALTLLACSMYSEDVTPAILPAIGLEMFHTFTLVHDDIMDNASLRRNKETIHKRWNTNLAILAGDALFIKAYEKVMQCPPALFADIFWIFNHTALRVCEGQQYDMNFEQREEVGEDEYLKMIELKTAVLIGACLQIGALIGGAPKKDALTLYEFGRCIGIAFQLQDDLLDVYAQTQALGKETGKDIVANKKTYLLIKALQKARPDQLSRLKSWLSRKNFNPQEKITVITRLYDELRVADECKSLIEKYHAEARQYLHSLPVKEEKKEELLQFANQLKTRQF